jgi:hypothetical protein
VVAARRRAALVAAVAGLALVPYFGSSLDRVDLG